MLDALGRVMADFAVRVLFYPTGWLFLKLVTLGRWSPKASWASERPESGWVVGLGLTIWAVAMMAALHQFVF